MSRTITALGPPRDDAGTVTDLFLRNVYRCPDAGALVDGDSRLTWGEYGRLAFAVALALDDLGVGVGDVVGLHQVNRHEHVAADVAALLVRAVPTSFYNTLAPEQLSYVAGDCDTKVAIVDAERLPTWERIRSDLPALEHLVVLDLDDVPDGAMRWVDLVARGEELLAELGDDRVLQLCADRSPDEPVTIIYTSGTTGPPKGVIVTHDGIRVNLEGADEVFADALVELARQRAPHWIVGGRLSIPPGEPGMSYLPLAHVAERFVSHYSAFNGASEITLVRDLLRLPELLPQVRPYLFVGVPRVWEKFHAGIMARIVDTEGPRGQLGLKAMEVAEAKGRAIVEGRRADIRTEALHAVFERLVYPKLRAAIGLDRCVSAFSSAAPLSPAMLAVFNGIGLPLIENYGMTEASPLISVTPPGEPRAGSVGRALPGTELRIADDGEILTRGRHVTPGYLNKPDKTAEAIDEDGWLHTGDLGELDADGYLRIIGRKKELIINAAGKNISPVHVEDAIGSSSPIIDQVMAYGDGKPYLTALIVLDAMAVPAWCERVGVPFESIEQAASNPTVIAEVERAVEEGNAHLARVEQVKRFRVLPHEWTPESGELTPTMKLKRRVVNERYGDEIEAMYGS